MRRNPCCKPKQRAPAHQVNCCPPEQPGSAAGPAQVRQETKQTETVPEDCCPTRVKVAQVTQTHFGAPTGVDYAYMQREAAKQSDPCKGGVQPAKDECLLFIQFRRAGSLSIRNALIRTLSIIKQYSGQVLGITDNVIVDGYPVRDGCCNWSDIGMALMLFPSQFLARRWYLSDIKWNQPDFLCDSSCLKMLTIPLRYLPNWDRRRTFLWTEFEDIADSQALQDCYVEPVLGLLEEVGALAGLAVVTEHEPRKVDGLKDSWIKPGSRIYLSLLNSLQDYDSIRDAYCSVICRRDGVCKMKTFVFTINPEITCHCDAPFACKRKQELEQGTGKN